jgi:hypothetical protein
MKSGIRTTYEALFRRELSCLQHQLGQHQTALQLELSTFPSLEAPRQLPLPLDLLLQEVLVLSPGQDI